MPDSFHSGSGVVYDWWFWWCFVFHFQSPSCFMTDTWHWALSLRIRWFITEEICWKRLGLVSQFHPLNWDKITELIWLLMSSKWYTNWRNPAMQVLGHQTGTPEAAAATSGEKCHRHMRCTGFFWWWWWWWIIRYAEHIYNWLNNWNIIDWDQNGISNGSV